MKNNLRKFARVVGGTIGFHLLNSQAWALPIGPLAQIPANLKTGFVSKFTATELATVTDKVREEAAKHPASHPLIIASSAETGTGIADLRTAIVAAVEGH